MDFSDIIGISNAGMKSQQARLRIAAENMANAETTGTTPGSDPYRRKTVSFKEMVDKSTGVSSVAVNKIGHDMSDFQMKYDPAHPAANEQGYVKMPNVNSIVEVMDTHDAQHSYDANLNTMQISRAMLTRTIGLLNK